MNPQAAVVVTGRRVKDFKLCHEPIPPTCRIYRCSLCRAKIVLSPEGITYLEQFAVEKRVPLCTPCTKVAAESIPHVAGVSMTKACSDRMDANPDFRESVLKLVSKLKYPIG